MSLLQDLERALNKVYGNTMFLHEQDLCGHEGCDEYWCTIGKHRVYEKDYVEMKHACYDCLHKDDMKEEA